MPEGPYRKYGSNICPRTAIKIFVPWRGGRKSVDGRKRGRKEGRKSVY